jgi:hypothetical protein
MFHGSQHILSNAMKLAMVGNSVQAGAARLFEGDSGTPMLVQYRAVGCKYTQDIHMLV